MLALQVRHGQDFAVDFAIWRQRHDFKRYIDGWHHIFRKCPGQEVLKLFYIYLSALRLRVIKDKLLLHHSCRHLLNTSVLAGTVLNLTEFYAETAQFDLMVYAA